jgi:hypothetical protein
MHDGCLLHEHPAEILSFFDPSLALEKLFNSAMRMFLFFLSPAPFCPRLRIYFHMLSRGLLLILLYLIIQIYIILVLVILDGLIGGAGIAVL